MTGQHEPVELGRGRSGVVYRMRDAQGRLVARKVFIGDPAGKIVHYILTGAPSAYIWSEDAVRCARVRRQILFDLVEFWFGPALGVANALDDSWNEATRSYRMDTEFVAGRPAALHHPFSAGREGECRSLMSKVMRPLQLRLAESGFDGLVWQAGRGNPVAANNFLKTPGPDDEPRWVWIDLESGVPALIPVNPLDLFGFYLPKSWRHRRPLFDDVDLPKLRAYVAARRSDLEKTLGAVRLEAIESNIDLLERHQDRWRSLPRVARGIEYRRCKGEISDEQAAWYREHALCWYGREARKGLRRSAALGLRVVLGGLRRVRQFDYFRAVRSVWHYMTSQRYRSRIAHLYIDFKIARWKRRGQLSTEEADVISELLHQEAVGSYITDFGVHVAMKPPIKLAQWVVVPMLFAVGLIPAAIAGLLIAFGGTISRTVYTLGRMAMAVVRREPLPWIALGVGLLPVVGNAAYPIQIVRAGAAREGKLAGFIVYDSITAPGEFFPIWGGADTATEHSFNRLADFLVRDRRPLVASIPDPGSQLSG